MSRPASLFVRAALAVALCVGPVTARAAGSLLLPRVGYCLTTDLPGLVQGDYQLELASVIASRTAWSVRAGYFAHRQASSAKYTDGKGRWEIGFRWRAYVLEDAPHWLFIGLGWNNRPQDTQLTPLAELGFSLNVRPASVTVLAFYGYELYLKSREGFHNGWVKGVEVRAGLCF